MPRREPLLVTHHGVEVRVVEIGASRRGVSRGAQTVYLRSGEIRRPRRQCRASEGPSGRVRLSHRHVELPVLAYLRVGLQKIAGSA
jgi:hypothetical protein